MSSRHATTWYVAALVGGFVLIASSAVSAEGARATTTSPGQPSPEQIAKAAGHMLVWEDVPKSMKVAPGWEFTSKADSTLALELCSKRGTPVLAPPVPIMFQVELGETDLQADPVAFQQDIWEFPDSAAAQRSWEVLTQRARRCAGRSIERAPGEHGNVQYLTNGTTDLEVDGRAGVWIHSRFARPVAEDAITEGGYLVVFLKDNVIQSVEYDYSDTKDLSNRLRIQVQRIAQMLADRWSAVPGSEGSPAL